jgi:hypothetical protein
MLYNQDVSAHVPPENQVFCNTNQEPFKQVDGENTALTNSLQEPGVQAQTPQNAGVSALRKSIRLSDFDPKKTPQQTSHADATNKKGSHLEDFSTYINETYRLPSHKRSNVTPTPQQCEEVQIVGKIIRIKREEQVLTSIDVLRHLKVQRSSSPKSAHATVS